MLSIGSVCSGIGGAELAFKGLGKCLWAAETEPFPRAVLKHHFPELKLHGDFTRIPGSVEPVDILIGGTPCQAFSIAGLRNGLDDHRGNLALEYLRLAGRIRPQWLVWENVPGVLSSNGGRDLASFLSGLGQLGYGFAYRVLDAQHFGIPQRRRRIFLVACLGNWPAAAAILFEPTCLRGYPPQSQSSRQDTAFTLTGGTDTLRNHSKRSGSDRDTLIPTTAPTLSAGSGSPRKHGYGLGTQEQLAAGFLQLADPITAHEAKTYTHEGRNNFRPHNLLAGVQAFGGNNQSGHIALATAVRGHDGSGYHSDFETETFVASASAVRRLTPLECERLQGFPDHWTNVTFRGRPASDGPRYRAIGNAFAVPVVEWIAQRIALYTRTYIRG